MLRPSVVIALTVSLVLVRAQDSVGGQVEVEPIVVGESVTFHSKMYDRDVVLSVYRPRGYSKSTQKYPVLYSMHTSFLHTAGTVSQLSSWAIPELIHVHLESYNSGDFLPTRIQSRPGSGGADRFIRFFETELIPFVDSRYRTEPFRILHSSSWGGLFGVYTLLTRPEAFNAVIAATPWVIYDGEQKFILGHAESVLKETRFDRNFLFMALGDDDDPGLREGVGVLAGLLNKPRPGLSFQYHLWLEEDHASTPHKALFDGLRWVFKPWREVPEDVLTTGVDAVRAYRKGLQSRFGFDIGLSRFAVQSHAQKLLRGENFAEAVALIAFNVELFPDAPFAHESLGRAYEASGRLEEALRCFEQAVKTAQEGSFPDLQRYRDHVDRVRLEVAQTAGE